MTTLCLDFGNTRLKAALFKEHQLVQTITLAENPVEHLEAILEEYCPTASILSSVIDHAAEIEAVLQKHTKFHRLSHQSKLPFTIPVGKPETVGTDRLAIAAAAVHLFPSQHNLVIALGTCITYNFINKDHQLVGGSISPGLEMRFRSMHEYTAKLPLVKGDWNVPLIGYDTVSNMQSGVILGMAKEIDGMIDAYKERFSNFNAVLTGGNLPFFESHLKNEIFADPDLIFKGLYAISKVNYA
ncbi:type III pantothenate kinase [Flavisolibacter tropicus]|uniref:Type III pantothenate kinase n=1 Tax=Flavisolibacter tropicus TaxID=1492898 RepID=A0A172TYA0_9BACT|nr:type III pantothenate kinase [Flavisolibacter tropicus]ANE51986.1 Baf family transcriptional regulator [Flavisolibacter tropicus]